jgi:hypothetical protein
MNILKGIFYRFWKGKVIVWIEMPSVGAEVVKNIKNAIFQLKMKLLFTS